MIEKRTVCPYDCPDSCGIIASVENNKLISVKGDPEHLRTAGFLCRKMKHYEELVNSPERILYPMKRIGKKGEGLFERITWQQAAETIASRWKEIIREYGPEAILPYSYAGTEGKIQKDCGQAFFHYLGASKLKRTICASAKSAGWSAIMGSTLAMPAHRTAECDYVIVWGSNVAATRVHEIPYIMEAKKKGARVILIEVYDSPAATYCDQAVYVKPGSDGALALAMIHVMDKEGLIDNEFISEYVLGYEKLKETLPGYSPEWAEQVTGVPAETIRSLALEYAKAKRPGIILGSGPSRHLNGAMITRCVAALPAVTGKLRDGFGVSGLAQSGKWGDMSLVTRPDFDKDNARTINMMQLAMALDKKKTNDPPVMSVYTYCSNPVAVTTNQSRVIEGFEREDLFTVVHERFMTDTARYADILLPAVFSLESDDVFCGYGYNAIQYAPKAIDPPGECLSNWDTYKLLAEALGFEDPYFKRTEKEMCLAYLDHATGQQSELSDSEWEELMSGKAAFRPLTGMMEIKTASGKVELYHEGIEDPLIGYKDVYPAGKYPLHLVAAPSLYTLNSTFTSQKSLTDKRGVMTLFMAKECAQQRGIKTDDEVICENDLASVKFIAKVIDGILPDTVVAEGVYTIAQSLNGYTVNALFSENLSDLGEATTMNGNLVQVRKA